MGAIELRYEQYVSERQLPQIVQLIEKDLSEPYSVYTYRFFLNNWPELCFMAMHEQQCVGVIICKLDRHRNANRGYIAMLAVNNEYRKNRIGTTLVKRAIDEMRKYECDEVVLETEVTNSGALALYDQLGFVRDKRLHRYYLNGVDAFRLKLWFT